MGLRKWLLLWAVRELRWDNAALSGASLAYYRGRYYRFDVGMWQSQDPLRFGAGDSNLYRYVRNGATNARDPSGLDQWDDMGAHQVVVAGIYAERFGGDRAAVEQNSREYWRLRRDMSWVPAGPNRTDWWLGSNYYNASIAERYYNGVVGIAGDVADMIGDAAQFTVGLTAGLASGGWSVVSGMLQFWNWIPGIIQLIDTIRNEDLVGVAAALFPDLAIICNTGWGNLSSYDRGYHSGRFLVQAAITAYGAYSIYSSVISRLRAANCFPPDTLVATETELKPISRVNDKDRVWAYDFLTRRSRNQRAMETAFIFPKIVLSTTPREGERRGLFCTATCRQNHGDSRLL